MKKLVALFTVVSLISSLGVLANPQNSAKKPAKPSKKTTQAAKVTDVWTCPITGAAIADHSKAAGKPVVVGDKRVHFCCAGCPDQFAKLSAKEKKEKVAAAAKKDAEATKKAKS